jgi:hypothetical protein
MNDSCFLRSSVKDYGYTLGESTLNVMAGFPGKAPHASKSRSLVSRS